MTNSFTNILVSGGYLVQSSSGSPLDLVFSPIQQLRPMDFSLGLIREQKRAGVVLVVCLTLTFRVGLIEKPVPVWVLSSWPLQLSWGELGICLACEECD